MLGNLYPALIKWPPGHTPLRSVVAGDDAGLCRALYSDNSADRQCFFSTLSLDIHSVLTAQSQHWALCKDSELGLVVVPCNGLSKVLILSAVYTYGKLVLG